MRDTHDTDDELLPRLFRALGPQPALPDDMKQSWEVTFGQELARQNARRRLRRRVVTGVACAATILIAVAVALTVHQPMPQPTVARVVMASGFSQARVPDGATIALGSDDAIASEATVRTGPNALLALRYRDTDVRLDSDTVVVAHPTRLQLERGTLYVDAGPGRSLGPALTVETTFGTVAHLGTQFLVSITDHDMRAAVREGAIAMDANGERRTINAADGAREAVVTVDSITIVPIPTTGGPWAWVAAAAPEYPIDGASADAFLHWAARQLGADLRYHDTATARHARAVTLHGDLHASVAQGIAIIDGTTDLAIDHSDPAVLGVRTRTPP